MSFDKILNETLRHEGFYAFVPGDSGGETYQGIARNYHPSWPGWIHIDMAKTQAGGKLPWNTQVKAAELNDLVKAFYLENFWKRAQLDYIQNTALQAQIFDFFVNAGGNAIKVLQRTLNKSFSLNLSVDGAMGPMTIGAINSVDGAMLFERYKLARVEYYEALAQKNSTLKKFLSGWKKRAMAFVYSDWQVYGLGSLALVLIGGIILMHYGKFSI
ncbi:glycoside hydrolase family 108 protein [Persicobacter sp. CCB-QB2]|uniref:glycoside hydrolase family 108 protein n=1 Tax=Persicobacter sp. CCB-QB2 TaxID=1561025 RepID=UPI0006A9C743|nr:glycosyl hydrolase 108 family protein [Persicobacter sp. CCB-QB2]